MICFWQDEHGVIHYQQTADLKEVAGPVCYRDNSFKIHGLWRRLGQAVIPFGWNSGLLEREPHVIDWLNSFTVGEKFTLG